MNRVLILVNITGLIIGISYGLHGPILPIFAKNVIGATYSELGFIGLANFVPYMFIPLFVGILLDRINNAYILAIGAAINSASIYLLSIAQSVPEIMGFRIMTGVAHAFFWPPCESIISNESTEKNRVKNISWFTMFFVMGFMIGPLLGTVFLENIDATYRILFQIAAFILAAGIITNIVNSTAAGVVNHAPSVSDKRYSNIPAGITNGLGFLNGTDFVLRHDAIPSDATYYINYTNNPDTGAAKATIAGGFGGFHSSGGTDKCLRICSEGSTTNKILKIGSNATAKDWMVPTATSAEILKSNAKQVRILMSEPIALINATLAHFNFTTSGGGNDAVGVSVFASNQSSYLYVNLQNPASISDVLTIQFTTADQLIAKDGHSIALNVIDSWITDAIDSTQYITHNPELPADAVHVASGHGNKLGNFTLSITNWLEIGMYGASESCYDCSAPTVAAVQVSLDGSTPVTVTNDNAVQINAGNGDTVSVMVTIADNIGADTMTFAGLYTNFGDAPDNLYYANNFDSFKSMSTSYYEWNARADDVAFGNTDAITWDAATATVNPDRTQTITYTMTINDSIESTQVWVDLGDKVGNYAKSALPITLEVAGPPALTFASDDSQQVVSYFNESILLAIVSQWAATSSDDATNVEQLSSVLGIEDQLPTWTTSLASWVSDDKIDVADMIVAVEYVINQ